MGNYDEPHTKPHHDDSSNDMDADAILASLESEDDPAIATLQSQRLTALATSHQQATTKTYNPSIYPTLHSDDDTLRHTTEHSRSIVHFFHPDFARCTTMDTHLTLIAQRHADFGTDSTEGEIKFARVDVQDADFVVQKLGIRVLPCVIGFVGGEIRGRVVGFEGLAFGKEVGLEVTKAVEERFVEWGVLRQRLVGRDEDGDDDSGSEGEGVGVEKYGRRGIQKGKIRGGDEDDEWD